MAHNGCHRVQSDGKVECDDERGAHDNRNTGKYPEK